MGRGSATPANPQFEADPTSRRSVIVLAQMGTMALMALGKNMDSYLVGYRTRSVLSRFSRTGDFQAQRQPTTFQVVAVELDFCRHQVHSLL